MTQFLQILSTRKIMKWKMTKYKKLKNIKKILMNITNKCTAYLYNFINVCKNFILNMKNNSKSY